MRPFTFSLLTICCSCFVTPTLFAAPLDQQKKSIYPTPTSPNFSSFLASLSTQKVNELLNMLNQNKGGFIQNDPSSAHYLLNHHLVFSARADGDAGLSTKTPARTLASLGRYNGEHSGSVNLTNLFLYADFGVTSWLNGHVAGLYNNNRAFYQRYDQNNSLTSRRVPDGINQPHFARSDYSLDEAFFTLVSPKNSLLFAEGGRFYAPFGNYQLHPLTETLPQQLSQIQGDGFEAGLLSSVGEHWGNIKLVGFAIKPAVNYPNSPYPHQGNFGAQLSYNMNTDAVGYTVDFGYLNNMGQVDYLATSTPLVFDSADHRKTGGFALDFLGHAGPFDSHINFVTLLKSFPETQIQFENSGAKPKAIDIGTGYRFDLLNHDSHFGISYQHSWQAAQLSLGSVIPGGSLPKQRVQSDYTINLLKNLAMQFQVHYDRDFSTRVEGTGKDSVTGLVRMTVVLA